MVEGHSVHRVAARHSKRLVGKKFQCSSPNGRFVEGAAAIDGKPFRAIEAVGKNLFAWFGAGDADDVVVHVHFGMAGNWAVFDKGETAPEATPTTRLLMKHESGVTSLLSAMTVAHGTRPSLYEPKRAKLGEDPLRADADAARLWAKVSKSKKSIGALIMDQSYFCGPGNIYRAEILFKARIHPSTPGNALAKREFDDIWRHTVALLRRGYEEGSINTVDAADEVRFGTHGSMKRYIYNKSKCPECGGRIVAWEIQTRTAYACETCQPKPASVVKAETEEAAAAADDDALVCTPKKKKKASKKRPASTASAPTPKRAHVPFPSHCVDDSREERLANPSKLSVKELRAELSSRGAATSGLKGVLVSRLQALQAADPPAIRSAEDAEADRAAAGESRAVEHVADLHPVQAKKVRRKAAAKAAK